VHFVVIVPFFVGIIFVILMVCGAASARSKARAEQAKAGRQLAVTGQLLQERFRELLKIHSVALSQKFLQYCYVDDYGKTAVRDGWFPEAEYFVEHVAMTDARFHELFAAGNGSGYYSMSDSARLQCRRHLAEGLTLDMLSLADQMLTETAAKPAAPVIDVPARDVPLPHLRRRTSR
jgi:hypothetical protein